jgi:hypothetical protein
LAKASLTLLRCPTLGVHFGRDRIYSGLPNIIFAFGKWKLFSFSLQAHNFSTAKMSNIASASLRQASRLYVRQASSALSRATPLPRALLVASTSKVSRRGYVSETKKDSAQVNVDTAIRADQKAFFAETGKLPENVSMQGTSVDADAMMSPIAGTGNFLKSGIAEY